MFHRFHDVKTSQETDMAVAEQQTNSSLYKQEDRSSATNGINYTNNEPMNLIAFNNLTDDSHVHYKAAPDQLDNSRSQEAMHTSEQQPYKFNEADAVVGDYQESKFDAKLMAGSTDVANLKTNESYSAVSNVDIPVSSCYIDEDPGQSEIDRKSEGDQHNRNHFMHPDELNKTNYSGAGSSTSEVDPGSIANNLKCHLCQEQFTNSVELKQHLKTHSGSKAFKCKYCQSTFTQISNLRTHLRIHTGEKPYRCRECMASFTQISNLRTHLKIHSGEKPHVCDVCSVAFSQASNLKSHRLIHSGERPYKCDVCNAAFVQSTHLRNHQRIHTDERPYTCLICKASFRQMSNLKTHEMTHTGARPHKCNHCEAAFAQKSNLKSHVIKLHSPEHTFEQSKRGRRKKLEGFKPHVCDECNATFTACSNLKIHRRIHTGEKPHVCNVCQLGFVQKSNLKAHELTHSYERPHQCRQCSSSFKQRAYLRAHLKKNHYVKQEDLKHFMESTENTTSVKQEYHEYGEEDVVEPIVTIECLEDCNQDYMLNEATTDNALSLTNSSEKLSSPCSSSSTSNDMKERSKRVEKKYIESCKLYKSSNKRCSKFNVLQREETSDEHCANTSRFQGDNFSPYDITKF